MTISCPYRGSTTRITIRVLHDVIRITDYGKPAANALEFKVYYLAPQSQAARNQRFVIMKTTESA